jgi:hypothetical protein
MKKIHVKLRLVAERGGKGMLGDDENQVLVVSPTLFVCKDRLCL